MPGTTSMIAFRQVQVEGPEFTTSQPLWQARLDLGAPAKDTEGQPPVVFNHSIRLLLERADPQVVPIDGAQAVSFLEPSLLTAAVTPFNFRPDSAGPSISIGKAQFSTVQDSALRSQPYSEIHVAPRSDWPPDEGFKKSSTGRFELTAPKLRATRGRMRVKYAKSGDASLKDMLSIDWSSPGDGYARIFGSLFIVRTAGADPNISFDLVPEGVEFDVRIPDPFAKDGDVITPAKALPVRVRLVVDDVRRPGAPVGLRLDLVSDGTADGSAFSALSRGLTWLSQNVAANGGCLAMQFDTRVAPPMSLPLTSVNGSKYACVIGGGHVVDTLPQVRLRESGITVRVITREDFGGGEPGVAELANHQALLSPRPVNKPLTLEVSSQVEPKPDEADAVKDMPVVTLGWSAKSYRNPDVIRIDKFSAIVEVEPIATRLGEVWSASGATAPGSRPPYAFFALDRGWVQMPLPPQPSKDELPVKPLTTGSAFRGFMRITIDRVAGSATPSDSITDDARAIGLALVAAQGVNVRVVWDRPLDNASERTVNVVVRAATGTLDGVLWTGEGSPSPAEILPPLDGGPAALDSVPISFGIGGKNNWQLKVGAVSPGKPGDVRFQLPLFEDVDRPLLAWRAHPQLALVSSVAMTRTADSAIRPSATRELVPAEVIETNGSELKLLFQNISSSLPSMDATGTAHGDGRWNWPWPSDTAAGPTTLLSSPPENAGVAMASLTLPGIEFTVSGEAIPPFDDMRVSLRYDLPILDELFANAKAPEPAVVNPKPPSQSSSGGDTSGRAAPAPQKESPPTALDLTRLSGAWFTNARRLARARTEADRVVLVEGGGDGVKLWHHFDGMTGGVVRGLAEPYVWKANSFTFKLTTPSESTALGAYKLGDADWASGPGALEGLKASFKIDLGDGSISLQQTPADISVDGFAASSFPAIDVAGHVQDARGLSMALDPAEAAQSTSRSVMMRITRTGEQFALATLRDPLDVSLGSTRLKFWFRDLPITKNVRSDDAHTAWSGFDGNSGIEAALGPDPAAIGRDRLAKGLYEWRLYPESESRGRYSFDLAGPLSARPLRLQEVVTADDGSVASFKVLVSAQIAVNASPDDKSPFDAEDAFATGNLATLTFKAADDQFILSGFERYHVAGEKLSAHPFFLTLTAEAAVNLSAPKPSAGIDNDKDTRSRTWISFYFIPGVRAGNPDISSAFLNIRLFGQDHLLLDTNTAGFPDEHSLTASFTKLTSVDGLSLASLNLRWERAAKAPEIDVVGALTARLHASDGPFAFQRSYNVDRDNAGKPRENGNLKWLDVAIPAGQFVEDVDHDLGVVRIDLLSCDPPPASKLFRGFLLPSGRLRGCISVVFQRPKAGDKFSRARIGSIFTEFAFDANNAVTPQRIQTIRHRHVCGRDKGDVLTWNSTMRLDASFAADDVSSVSWPVNQVRVGTGAGPFDFTADPGKIADWNSVRLTIDPAHAPAMVLQHHVSPRICAHEFPLDQLGIENDEIVLQKPWRFRAVADHALEPQTGVWPGTSGADATQRLSWTSLDEVCLVDMIGLVRAATDAKAADYAFLARYQRPLPSNSTDVPIAGVVRRALAEAGFPTGRIAGMLAPKTGDPPPPASLILTGAAVTEVFIPATAGSGRYGVTMVPQWILLWAPPPSTPHGLGKLGKCPQCDDATAFHYPIAPYDAAAGMPRPLDGAPSCAFSAQDGTQPLIDGRFTKMIGGEASALIPVDQAILGDKAVLNNGPNPTQPAAGSWPLFPRTLLAMKTVADAFGAALNRKVDSKIFAQGFNCITATADRSAGGAVRFSVTAWPTDVVQPDPVAPGVTLVVSDEVSVRACVLPADVAATLVDPGSDELKAEGSQLGDAAMRALSLSSTPRAVLLARIDDSYLTIYGNEGDAGNSPGLSASIATAVVPPPQLSWLHAELPAALPVASRPLRKAADTLYASPTLGWPQGGRESELARSQARLGKEEVRRNSFWAWAGRMRGLAWPAMAWAPRAPRETDGDLDPTPVAEMGDSAFFSTGQRVALRRLAAKGLRSPADRLSVLAPPRARAPTIDAMTAAFMQVRIPVEKNAPPGLAPMLPGPLEITVTGQRPGVLLAQYEALLLTSYLRPFDPEFSRFGRPASRGPVSARQVRSPRSAALPAVSDLTVRRRTFIGADEGPDNALKMFKLVRGPAVIARYDRDHDGSDRDARSPHAVTFTIASPVLGRLAADWDGTIKLKVTVPAGAPSAGIALARLGLLPNAETVRAELQVGDAVVVFGRMQYSGMPDDVPAPGPDPQVAYLNLIPDSEDARSAAQLAVARALLAASADTPVRLTIRGGKPLSAAMPDPATPVPGTIDLYEGESGPLSIGPPRILVFDLPHVPGGKRWLPVDAKTMAFGDPAYDRELGSPVMSAQVGLDNSPHVFAVDRADYDLAATIYFAFWKRPGGSAGSTASQVNPPEAPAGSWALRVLVIPRDGSTPRRLRIAGAAPLYTPTQTNPFDDPRYPVDACTPYALALSALREPAGPGNQDAKTPARIVPGDRIQIGVSRDPDGTPGVDKYVLTVNVGVVAEPVIPPPAAIYGLATLGETVATSIPVRTALFATAPLPQVIEFPDLYNDLVLGHVRRRGLFIWPIRTARASAVDGAADTTSPFAYLVKVDRTGGGQLPASKSEFQPCEDG